MLCHCHHLDPVSIAILQQCFVSLQCQTFIDYGGSKPLDMYLQNYTCDDYLGGQKSFLIVVEADMLNGQKLSTWCSCVDCENEKQYSVPVHLNLSAILFQRRNSVFLSQQISISIIISQISASQTGPQIC